MEYVSSGCVGEKALKVEYELPSLYIVLTTVAPWIADKSAPQNTCNSHHVERVKCPIMPCRNNKNLNISTTPKLGPKNQLVLPSG